MSTRPLIGMTPDVVTDAGGDKFALSRAYGRAVVEAGGLPIILDCHVELVPHYLDLCDGFILSGGDDPAMERWGVPTHPKATPIAPDRQEFELALLDRLDRLPETPVLGICLGMQLMGLHAGGALDQYLPDALPTAADHWGRKPHAIDGDLGRGIVLSHHRQALTSPGTLRITAAAPDGVIEAIAAPDRSFYLGVQWHPERTEDETLGRGLIRRLVKAATAARRRG